MTPLHKTQSSQPRGRNVPSHKGVVHGLWKPLAISALLTITGQVSAGTVTTPRLVSNDCMVCHGMTGHNTIYPIVPRLAGQQKSYLKAQLTAYQDRARADQNGQIFMWPVADALDKAKILELAAYFAAQKPPMQSSGVKHAGIAQGKLIFNQGINAEQVVACSACHGADAQGAGTFPRLAGQRYQYMVQQLTYFHNGTRVNMLMNSIAKNITKVQIKEVAAYLSSP